MPILDSDKDVLAQRGMREQALEEYFYARLLTANVSEIETDINLIWKKIVKTWHVDEGSTMFVYKLIEMLNKKECLNPMLRRYLGRPVYTLDCRYLHKGDAIGWLEKVAKLPKLPKPILVIENITEIPTEERNLLLHDWKNPVNNFFNLQNSFKIIPADYTVFITWTPENRGKMDTIHQLSDGFAWIGDFEKYKEEFLAPYRASSIEELENKRIISYGQ